jgi:BirA family biotin operon repressor/biotin-[acetyl-CoA-carboxylase] ligase
VTADLSVARLAAAMPGRPVRSYPALLSTEATAMAWAREGGPSGAVVVADYQAAPRGRGGLPWQTTPGSTLCFSVVLRPELPVERQGWSYVAASLAITDLLSGADVATEWPDRVVRRGSGDHVGSVKAHVQLGPGGTDWVVVSVLIEDARPGRDLLLASCVGAIETRMAQAADAVLEGYRSRCVTLGRPLRARLIPMGPDGVQVVGTAVDVRADGALVIDTAEGRRVAVLPQAVGLLEPVTAAQRPG